MKVSHGTEASGGGRSAPATLITLGFKPEKEEDNDSPMQFYCNRLTKPALKFI